MVRNFNKMAFVLSGALAVTLTGTVFIQDAEAQGKKQQHQVKQGTINTLGNAGGGHTGGKDEKGVPYGTPTISQKPGTRINLYYRHGVIGGVNRYVLKNPTTGNSMAKAKIGMDCGPGGNVEILAMTLLSTGEVDYVQMGLGPSKVIKEAQVRPFTNRQFEDFALIILGDSWEDEFPEENLRNGNLELKSEVQVWGKCQGGTIKSIKQFLRFNTTMVDTDYPN